MRVFGIGFLMALAACAGPVPERGEFVPVRQLMAETADTPWQCSRLTPGQDSCHLVASLRRDGRGYVLRSRLALRLGGTTYMEIVERLEERDGTICVLTEQFVTVPVGDRPSRLFEDFEGVTPPAPPPETICYAWWRNPEGGYLTGLLDAEGRLDPQSLYPVEFLAEEPRLRSFGI